MTAIICIHDPKTGAGAMAAESCWSSGISFQGRPKISRLDSYLVAAAGSSLGLAFVDQLGPWSKEANRQGVLEAGGPYDTPESLHRFAERWREWCEARGHHEQIHGARDYPAFFLFLGPGGIFQMTGAGEVFQHVETVMAIGSGAYVALGAAHALTRPQVIDNHSVAKRSIEAAIRYSDGCEGPVQVVTISNPPDGA